MSPATDAVRILSDPDASFIDKRRYAAAFSRGCGWRPNDLLDVPGALPATNLVVEQGLENAAMLSFLPANIRVNDVRDDDRRDILGLSYNSLVDWHIWIDQESVHCFHNRFDPPVAAYTEHFDRSDFSALTRTAFDQAVGRTRNPNVLALDDALLGTIANLKDILGLELPDAKMSISALFNAIILVRAVEDFDARTGTHGGANSLLDYVRNRNVSIGRAIEYLMAERTHSQVSDKLYDSRALEPFESLSTSSRIRLVEGFYQHEAVPYAYDFSVMSKYALSKLYERYVAVMRDEHAVQLAWWPSAPEDRGNKGLGGVYTPQYIASFFAKYLRKHVPPREFSGLTVADPACGSGIFLRAATEEKLLANDNPISGSVGPALNAIFGVDVDANAVAAARLSLALLHLAAAGKLPDDIPIERGDSLEIFASSSDVPGPFDSVMVNPPFVRTELQPDDLRAAIRQHTSVAVRGKADTYLAFLILSILALKPNGYGCFVIPQQFLTSPNLKRLRDWVMERAWVHLVADLSAIRVFKASVYVNLLIVQKKDFSGTEEPPVSVIRCQRDVGAALVDFLDGHHRRTSSYSIFQSPQESLKRTTWSVPFPEETDLLRKLDAMPRLNDVAVVRQGMITGAKDVFIVDSQKVPEHEREIYQPFLPDAMIGRYALPEETDKQVLYPFLEGAPVDAAQMERYFPETWERLNRFRDYLSSRRSAPSDPAGWWRPSSPRSPKEMFVPKIVAPELILLPRFGIDLYGRWAVGHSPYVRARTGSGDEDSLLVLTAVLNSSLTAWYIDLNARKYRNGYNKIGVALLRQLPIPDFGQIPKSTIRAVASAVRELADSSREFDYFAASSLDDLVLRELYFLDAEDIRMLKPQSFL